MVPLTSLWLPILVSAALVFIASSIIHMVLGYHAGDYKQVPEEDKVQAALRPFNVPPGDYFLPWCASPSDMKKPAFVDKMTRGPVAVMTVLPNGIQAMGAQLALWFVYAIIVSAVAGYVAGRAVPVGGEYLEVFRFAGTTAFVAYSFAHWQETIWYKRDTMTSLKNTIDGLIYGLLTAGAFGWLWPR